MRLLCAHMTHNEDDSCLLHTAQALYSRERLMQRTTPTMNCMYLFGLLLTHNLCLCLQQCLHFSNEQLKKLFLLRRAYLQKSALISGQQQELQQQLQSDTSTTDSLEHVQIAHQIQDNSAQQREAFMQYLGLIVDGVSCHLCCISSLCQIACWTARHVLYSRNSLAQLAT